MQGDLQSNLTKSWGEPKWNVTGTLEGSQGNLSETFEEPRGTQATVRGTLEGSQGNLSETFEESFKETRGTYANGRGTVEERLENLPAIGPNLGQPQQSTRLTLEELYGNVWETVVERGTSGAFGNQ